MVYIEVEAAGVAIYQASNTLTLAHTTLASNAIMNQPKRSAGLVISTDAVARLSATILDGNTQANIIGAMVEEGFNLSSSSFFRPQPFFKGMDDSGRNAGDDLEPPLEWWTGWKAA